MRILVADDDPVSRRLLESSLDRWGYEAVVVGDGDEAFRVLLSAQSPHMAILDWSMPGMDGTQLCRTVRQTKPEPYTYVVLLISKNARDDVILGLEAGADDYVTKPFDPAELKVRLWTGKRIVFLQDELISSREALRDVATHDHLTGLLSRGAIVSHFGTELSRARRESTPLGVVIADVDHFKQINDNYGHPTGDQVLCRIASAVRESVRPYDHVGRYGGEEFLTILPGCGRTETLMHAERLRDAVSQVVVVSADDAIRVTLSLGVAVAEAGSIWEAFELIQAADDALYKTKHAGRNRVEFGEAVGLGSKCRSKTDVLLAH